MNRYLMWLFPDVVALGNLPIRLPSGVDHGMETLGAVSIGSTMHGFCGSMRN